MCETMRIKIYSVSLYTSPLLMRWSQTEFSSFHSQIFYKTAFTKLLLRNAPAHQEVLKYPGEDGCV